MFDKKYFLLFCDLDSTFEAYKKSDEFGDSLVQFSDFVNIVERLEKELCCKIKIHFVSGVDRSDLFSRIDYFYKNFKSSIYERIDDCVISSGTVLNKKCQVIAKCDTDKSAYSKADGICYLLKEYGPSDVCGACFLGDSKEDISAFMMIKAIHKNLGTYALAPRSTRDYDKIINYVDFYSSKPRIVGCNECLEKMEKHITKQIQQNK